MPSDSYLSWQGNVQRAFRGIEESLTICTRLRFYSVWQTSRFIQLTDEGKNQHPIQIGYSIFHTQKNKLVSWTHLVEFLLCKE